MNSAAGVVIALRASGTRPVMKPAEKRTEVKDRETRQVREEVAFYRKYTEKLLRRYMRMSFQVGRVPSVLGLDPEKGRVTSYRMDGFEDSVIFCVDVEHCLKKVSGRAQAVLVRVALQEYTVPETARMLGVVERTVIRQYQEGLDELTEILLEVGLMKPNALQ